MSNHYQNSECKGDIGWLHDFRQVDINSHGVKEVCKRCKKTMFFKHNIPNHIYLSYHLRSALQPNDPLFSREYPNFK